MAPIAASVLVLRAASASSNPIHVLVGLAGVLSKVDTSTKHTTYVGVALVKTLLCYGLAGERFVIQNYLIFNFHT